MTTMPQRIHRVIRLIFVLIIVSVLSTILVWSLYLDRSISYFEEELLVDGTNSSGAVIIDEILDDETPQTLINRSVVVSDEEIVGENNVEKKKQQVLKKFHSKKQTFDACRGIHWKEITVTLPRHSIGDNNDRGKKKIGRRKRQHDLQSRMHEIASHVKLYAPLMESEDSSKRTVVIIPNALQLSLYRNYKDKNQPDGAGSKSRDILIGSNETRKFGITMATHMGVGKYARFRVLVQRWNGPISVAVIIHSLKELEEFHVFVSQSIELLHHVTFHYYIEFAPELRTAYPQNILRNLALEHVQTDYFLVNDVDIFPSPLSTHDLLRDTIASHMDVQQKIHNDTFFAIPMFDLHEMIEEEALIFNHPSFPETKRDAKRMNATGIISQHLPIRHPRGHRAINYTKWFATGSNDSDDMSSRVSYPIKHENKFEPYVVGSKLMKHNGGHIPPYYPYYRGFGFDKYSWYAELEFAGFKLEVLRDFFMFHVNHESSYGDKPARKKLFAINKICARGFMEDIVKKYGPQDNALWDDWVENVYDTPDS